MIVVPEAFAASTIAREGDTGRAWVAALPGVVESLCKRWKLAVEGAPMHGYVGVVVPVRRGAEPFALKVSYPDDDSAGGAPALAAWDGDGAVRLVEADHETWAMLLERLDHTRTLATAPAREAISVAARLMRRLAIPAVGTGFQTMDDRLAAIRRLIPERWAEFGEPFPRPVLERAIEATTIPVRASLLVDWDLHYDNVLAGTREPWLVVDPKVVVGDPEFGLAQLFYNRAAASEGLGFAEQFAIAVEAAEADAALATEWTLVRCVDVGLWCLSAGLTTMAAWCFEVAEAIDGHPW
ncbi:MAG: aminoglycoside phosphotransferase family protein [Dehalococcoidia bacterium]